MVHISIKKYLRKNLNDQYKYKTKQKHYIKHLKLIKYIINSMDKSPKKNPRRDKYKKYNNILYSGVSYIHI